MCTIVFTESRRHFFLHICLWLTYFHFHCLYFNRFCFTNRIFLTRLNFAFQFEDLFKPYTKYCFEQKPCQEYIKQRYRDNDLFRIYVAVSLNLISIRRKLFTWRNSVHIWLILHKVRITKCANITKYYIYCFSCLLIVQWAEAQKQCNRLKLADLLVTPMHRLTRYKLLLAAIHKETTDETQKKDILHMVRIMLSPPRLIDSNDKNNKCSYLQLEEKNNFVFIASWTDWESGAICLTSEHLHASGAGTSQAVAHHWSYRGLSGGGGAQWRVRKGTTLSIANPRPCFFLGAFNLINLIASQTWKITLL